MSLETPKSPESFGRNVRVSNLYFRHAEKQSGTAGQGAEISSSLISERGKMQSQALGEQLAELTQSGKALKIESSTQPRTLETADAIVQGKYGDREEIERFNSRIRLELSAELQPKDWAALYIRKWEEQKRLLLEEKGIGADTFATLSPAEQAEIAEMAEIPVIEEWLDDPQSQLAQLYPPEHAAANFAPLVWHDWKSTTRLYSNSAVDRLRTTHKTIMEPLLMRILILPNEKKAKKLADIGGQMGLNDGWELRALTDAHGAPSAKLFMYRVRARTEERPEYDQVEYGIDLVELERLAKLGLALKLERSTDNDKI